MTERGSTVTMAGIERLQVYGCFGTKLVIKAVHLA